MTEVPLPKEEWSGKIREVTLGKGEEEGGSRNTVTIGGQTGLPFLSFENESPHRPAIAGEVLDKLKDFPDVVREVFGDAVDDPAQWAKKWEEFGADAICLRFLSTNPEEEDRSPEEAAETVKEVLDTVKLPLIVYGCGHEDTDAKTMEAVSNAAPDERLVLGHAEEDAYKSISAAAMSNDHVLIGFSNLDINLAKQINILLTDFDVDLEDVIADPLMAALGVGLEYSYSVNERIRLAALMGDNILQNPMICDASAAWGAREATDPSPELGDVKERGDWWEATTGIAAIMSGADMLIVRSPGAMKIINEAVDDLRGGD